MLKLLYLVWKPWSTLPYDGLYREAPPERGIFFRLQVYKRVGISLGKFVSTNQKHYPDLSSDASSVWNFCACFSDVISRGNRWWRREMSSVGAEPPRINMCWVPPPPPTSGPTLYAFQNSCRGEILCQQTHRKFTILYVKVCPPPQTFSK